MAIIKISDRNAPIYKSPAVTNLDNNLEPVIIEMSLVEVDYTLYYFSVNTSITGTIENGDAWIKLVPSENTLLPQYTNTAPVYDETRKGYYEPDTNDRYLLKFTKNGNNFESKKLIYDKYGNIDIFKMNKTIKELNDLLAGIIFFPSPYLKKTFNNPAGNLTGLAFDGTNLISCDSGTDKIYVHDKISATILNQFSAPAVSCSGVTFDGINLISCDGGTHKIYVHSGISATILSQFPTPSLNNMPSGLAFDGTNLISCDSGTGKIYIHDGISETILDRFSAPATVPYGIVFDGVNLISCDAITNKIYIHDGISSKILIEIASPADTPNGVAFDGSDLISSDAVTGKIYVHYSQALR